MQPRQPNQQQQQQRPIVSTHQQHVGAANGYQNRAAQQAQALARHQQQQLQQQQHQQQQHQQQQQFQQQQRQQQQQQQAAAAAAAAVAGAHQVPLGGAGRGVGIPQQQHQQQRLPAQQQQRTLTDQAVALYLEQRGYKEAAEALKKEGNISRTRPLWVMALSNGVDANSSVMKSIKEYNQKECSPMDYERSFTCFEDWVDQALDMYKQELSSFLFPVFVHFFLSLIERGFSTDAVRFFGVHKDNFEPRRYKHELDDLAGLQTTQQIMHSNTAQKYKLNRVEVQISARSYQLLLSLLEDAGFMLLLKVINDHTTVTVVRPIPSDVYKDKAKSRTVLTGLTRSDTDRINQGKVLWGSILDENEKNPKLPLPTPQADEAKSASEDRKARFALSRTTLPSVCLYTFMHSVDSVCSMGISRNGQYVAAGMSHSTVRLWNLSADNDAESESATDAANDAAKQNGAHDDMKDADDDTDMSDPNFKVTPLLSETFGGTTSSAARKKDKNRNYMKGYPVELIGHSGAVYGLSFDANDQYLLSCSEDQTVRLWSVDGQKSYATYEGHSGPVWDVDFSPLGYYFATASFDGTACLWSTNRVRPLRVFAGHLSDVDVVKFHPNCHYVATASTDKTVRLFDVTTGQFVRLFVGHQDRVTSIAFSADGRFLVSGAADNRVIAWDLSTQTPLQELGTHDALVSSVSCSSGTREGIVASGSLDSTIKIFDTSRRGSSQPCLKTFYAKHTQIIEAKFTARNLLLAAGKFVGPDGMKLGNNSAKP